ncbi:MAG: DUF1460 domain-containing protein [Prevotella sp.]|nr:DUF1460 domain-containing protein [Prevotella sp.]
MKTFISIKAFAIALCLGTVISVSAQRVTYDKADSTEIVAMLQNGKPSTLHFANQLLGRPYVAHTLEVNDNEQLVVNTHELDCTTLVETVTALTLCAENGKKTFADYCEVLQQLRYRQGQLTDYTSRLHYFSDWIEDKQKMGIVTEVQKNTYPFTAIQQLDLYYMSRHPSAYASLKRHPEMVKEIARQEHILKGRHFRYIPKKDVKNTAALRSTVKDGDIIAITCKKPGLDIAHLGFAVWKEDGLHLLNASQLHKKVVLEPMTLRQYLYKHPSHTGIRIIRIQNKNKN